MENLTIRKYIDETNVEYLLFLNASACPCVRVRDLDAGENLALVIYKDIAQAEAEFYSLVAKVQKFEGEKFAKSFYY